jgi:hypothetical protein
MTNPAIAFTKVFVENYLEKTDVGVLQIPAAMGCIVIVLSKRI